MAEKIKCKVIGPAQVDGVAAPGTVVLDPEVYNIEALVYAGHIEDPAQADADQPPDVPPADGGASTSASGARKAK